MDLNSAQKIESDLDVILSMIDELQEVDTSKIEPMFSPIEQTAIVYDDVISSDNLKEEFLTQAPNSDNNFFKVPKVVE